MMLDILTTNQENILEALTRLRMQLDELEIAVRDGDRDCLKESLVEAGKWRNQLESPSDGKR
jgi:prephenate dehydrogenase